jgi:F0F1-type ATP synthase epsilon subunit
VSLELVIVTPTGEVYHGPVATVVLPGTEGDFGVLPGHERFLAPLRIGSSLSRPRTGAWCMARSLLASWRSPRTTSW